MTAAVTSTAARRAESERIARSYVERGVTGADLIADLLDTVDELRHGRVVPESGSYRLWRRASGFATDGPEVA